MSTRWIYSQQGHPVFYQTEQHVYTARGEYAFWVSDGWWYNANGGKAAFYVSDGWVFTPTGQAAYYYGEE